MPNNPGKTEERIAKVLIAWETLCPGKRFGGLSLAEFKAAVQPSLDARERILGLLMDLEAEQGTRDTADGDTLKVLAKVINGVKGDPDEGDDSSLCEAMGYVRKSQRRTGLTRKARPAAPPVEAAP